MSWLNANDYLVMDVVARDRAEELLESSTITFATASDDATVAPESVSPRPARARSPLATGSCCVSRAA
jgi:hypothetical protein